MAVAGLFWVVWLIVGYAHNLSTRARIIPWVFVALTLILLPLVVSLTLRINRALAPG